MLLDFHFHVTESLHINVDKNGQVISENFVFLDSTLHVLDYYISMFMIGLNHRFMHAR